MANTPPPSDTGVIVYTTPLCSPCDALKAFLTREGVAFSVVDVMMDEAAADRLDDLNIRSTPALEVDGRFLSAKEMAPDALRAIMTARHSGSPGTG